jgi:hypothetical protein
MDLLFPQNPMMHKMPEPIFESEFDAAVAIPWRKDVSHVVEHGRITYKGFPGAGCRFFAVPVKIKEMGTFPVRAFGLVEEPA